MRILITGARGQLGQALQQALSGEDLILKDLPEFDLTRSDSESQIVAVRPTVILHAGAYTDVDGAEREPSQARAVNAQGTACVARAAAALNARLIYVSTDYVFDGTQTTPYREEDIPHPINVYGQSKREGEIAALRECPNTLVVRTAWLYGHAGNNFVKTIMRLASEKPLLEVVGDQRGCPTNADDLALVLKDLLGNDLRGICHVTNTGDCTWGDGYSLIYSYGEKMNGQPVPLGAVVAPGEEVDVSINFKAPEKIGSYTSAWQMVTPRGISFGAKEETLLAVIVVQ